MHKYNKLSNYRVKKILKCFAEDITATNTSKLLKLNKKTILRYYSKFRSIVNNEIENVIKKYSNDCTNCIGHLITDSENPVAYKILELQNRYYCYRLKGRPKCNKYFISNEHSADFFRFHYTRLSKFYGLTSESRNNQIMESSLRYNRTEEEIFNMIWNKYNKLR